VILIVETVRVTIGAMRLPNLYIREGKGRKSACRGRGSDYRGHENGCRGCDNDYRKHESAFRGRQSDFEAGRVLEEVVGVIVKAMKMDIEAVRMILETMRILLEAVRVHVDSNRGPDLRLQIA
jgi:hypothetical protein